MLLALVLTVSTSATTTLAQSWTEQELDQRTPTSGVALADASKAQRFQASQAYKKGSREAERGAHDAALRSFRAAYGYVKSPAARLGVVSELNALGRHAEAYEEGLELLAEVEEASRQDAAANQATLEAGRAQLEAAKAAIALVTVNVAGAAAGDVLVVNDMALDSARWGRPLPVAPGPIIVVLTTSLGEVLEAAEATAGQQIEIAIAAPKEAAAAPLGPEQAEPVVASDGGGPDKIMLAAIAGGVGALGMLNFGIFGALTEGQVSRLDSGCPNVDDCDPKLEDEASKGRTYQTLANVSLVFGIVGAAAAAGLVTWELLDDGAETETGAVRPWIAVGPAALVVGGSF